SLSSMAPLAHTLALLAMTVATTAIEVLPLNMAPDSFDDLYRGCRYDMMAALPALNRSEFQKNRLFAGVWVKATAAWQKKGSRVSPLSSPEQAIALMAYSMRGLYKEFNAAVRVAGRSRQEYRDHFHFKVLHFLLTDALVTLRAVQGQMCRYVFRGVRGIWFTAKRGDTVRFSQFTSTSLSRDVAHRFGNDTVFQVRACHGADIQDFSRYPNEREVLIPPFETFKVTNVIQDGKGARIHLSSTGTHSNYNCEWLRGDVTEGTNWGHG
ncbi:NRT2 ribosyltransferase, partial [Oreocharis arfaki]|nr:NRT2 ribosyltransferase [Oreocharis arfaki]